MRITINVPDPKFGVGDFIRYTETAALHGLLVIARVYSVIFNGTWVYHPDEESQMYVSEAFYVVIVQEGSFTTKKTPLRPGMLFTCQMNEIHDYAEKVEYHGEVWAGDTVDNISERI